MTQSFLTYTAPLFSAPPIACPTKGDLWIGIYSALVSEVEDANEKANSLSMRLGNGEQVYTEALAALTDAIDAHDQAMSELQEMLPPPALIPGASQKLLKSSVQARILSYRYNQEQMTIERELLEKLKEHGGRFENVPAPQQPSLTRWMQGKRQRVGLSRDLAAGFMETACALFTNYVRSGPKFQVRTAQIQTT